MPAVSKPASSSSRLISPTASILSIAPESFFSAAFTRLSSSAVLPSAAGLSSHARRALASSRLSSSSIACSATASAWASKPLFSSTVTVSLGLGLSARCATEAQDVIGFVQFELESRERLAWPLRQNGQRETASPQRRHDRGGERGRGDPRGHRGARERRARAQWAETG